MVSRIFGSVIRLALVVSVFFPLKTGWGAAGRLVVPRSCVKEKAVESFEKLVSGLIDLELEKKQELLAWDEQKSRLETLVGLLESEKKELAGKVADVDGRRREEQSERERTAADIIEFRQQLSDLSKEAERAARSLLAAYAKLPQPLQLTLENGAGRLEGLFAKSPAPLQAGERLRAVAAFGYDLQRVLSEVHVAKQVLTLGPEDRREADVLYVGGVVGFYLLPGGREAGILRYESGVWQAVPCNEKASMIGLALAVAGKEKPPTLVRLPLPQVKK